MPVRFSCPACGERLEIAKNLAGERVTCPICGKGVRLREPVARAAPSVPERDAGESDDRPVRKWSLPDDPVGPDTPSAAVQSLGRVRSRLPIVVRGITWMLTILWTIVCMLEYTHNMVQATGAPQQAAAAAMASAQMIAGYVVARAIDSISRE
jgi:hypothetical protein